jgi:hypothetical protein
MNRAENRASALGKNFQRLFGVNIPKKVLTSAGAKAMNAKSPRPPAKIRAGRKFL